MALCESNNIKTKKSFSLKEGGKLKKKNIYFPVSINTYLRDCLHGRHVPPDHEESEYAGGGAAHAHQAVHEDAT